MTGRVASDSVMRALRGALVILALAMSISSPVEAADGARKPLEIWFIRHGESDINVPTVPHPVPDDGVTYPLTKKGVEQANALANALADVPVTAIYASTRLRTVQTADAIAFKHSLTLRLAPEAVEVNLGIDRAKENSGTVYRELAQKWIVDKDHAARHGAGESFTEVERRFVPFVRELMHRHANDSGVIVVVAHAATLGFMVPVVADNIPPGLALTRPLPNTGIVKTELRDGRLVCTEWAGLPSSKFTP